MQPTVSLSSTEAEYRVLTDAAKDIIYFRRLIAELGLESTTGTSLLSDNQSYIKLVENPVLHSRTKHIGIQHHFIREVSKVGDIKVHYIPHWSPTGRFSYKTLTPQQF
jgi:hypothetical protein